MRMRFNLYAGAAEATRVRALAVLAFFAIEGLGESHGGEAFADPFFTMKEIGMRDAIVLDGGLQDGLGSFMSDDFLKHVYHRFGCVFITPLYHTCPVMIEGPSGEREMPRRRARPSR